jgi:predicted Zn finger-like uncharacterized protein
MIEVQCPSCQTRYRIDEGVLPQDSPTFKCSRCGHVFAGDPRVKRAPAAKPKPAPPANKTSAPAPASQPSPVVQPNPTDGATPRRAGAPTAAPSIALTQPPAPKPVEPADRESATPVQPQARRPAPSPGLPSAAVGQEAQPAGRFPDFNLFDSPPPARSPQRPRNAAALEPAPTQARSAPGDADNPLARSFGDEEPKTPENLSFDFGDDAAEGHQLGETSQHDAAPEREDRYERWQVGDPETDRIEALEMTPELARYRARRAALAQRGTGAEKPAIAEPDGEERHRMRSSGFFLGLFALIVIAFAFGTFVLGISPSSSRGLLAMFPVIGGEFTPPAPHPGAVSLRDVHAEYRRLDSHRHALIVSGRAENTGAEPLHTIQVGVSLVDNTQHPVLSQTVFCGDLVSPKIVSQMTPHELQFFQKLAPPKNFVLKSGDSTPFFVMFINPPRNVANFQVSILKTESAAGDSTTAAGI